MIRPCKVLPLLAFPFFIATQASHAAAVLTPGATASISGLSSLPPGIIVSQNSQPTGEISFHPGALTLTTTVYRENATGFLDFIYAMPSPQAVGYQSYGSPVLVGFSGFDVDADFIGSTATPNHPQNVSRTFDGNEIDFGNWLSSSNPSLASLIVRTSSTDFSQNTTFTIELTVQFPSPTLGDTIPNPFENATFQTYGPLASSVPEPSSVAFLLLVCSAGLLLSRRTIPRYVHAPF